MIYILCCILCTAALFFIFRAFDTYHVNRFQAVVINYLTCTLFGLSRSYNTLLETSHGTSWWFFAILLGTLFIIMFNVTGLSSAKIGAGISSVASKMSLAIPITYATIFLGEELNLIRKFGIGLALVSVLFTAYQTEKKQITNLSNKLKFIIIIIVFLGSGIIDLLLKHVEKTILPVGGLDDFLTILFGTAFVLGTIGMFVFKELPMKKSSIIGGILLGSVNYFSLVFLMKALNQPNLPASVVFPLNNMGIVMATVLLGIIFFKERLSPVNWLGIALALVSIFLFSYDSGFL